MSQSIDTQRGVERRGKVTLLFFSLFEEEKNLHLYSAKVFSRLALVIVLLVPYLETSQLIGHTTDRSSELKIFKAGGVYLFTFYLFTFRLLHLLTFSTYRAGYGLDGDAPPPLP